MCVIRLPSVTHSFKMVRRLTIIHNYFIYQVTVEYKNIGGECIPQRIHTIVISAQHSEDISLEEMRKQLKEVVIKVSYTSFLAEGYCNQHLS